MPSRISDDSLYSVILVLAVAAVLTAIQLFIPQSVQQQSVFDHSEFVWYTLWTSAYVHLDLVHLYGNLVGFLVVMLALGILFDHRDRQPILRWSLICFILVFPILVSLSDYVIFYRIIGAENAATRGFSGVVAGLFGLLLASLLEFVWEKTSIKEASGVGLAIVLSTMVMMLVIGGEASFQTLLVGGFGVLLSLLLGTPWDNIRRPRELLSDAKNNLEDVAVVFFEILSLVLFLPLLFPLGWLGENSLTNIFGHFAGLLLGVLYGALLGLVLTERGKIIFRKRKDRLRVYRSRILVWIFHRKTFLAITLPIGFGTIGFFASDESSILAGATLLYATVLLFREIPDQVSLRINSIGLMDSKEDHDKFAILSYVENLGDATAEDVIVYYRFYDPVSNFSSREREAPIKGGSKRDVVNIDPGHQETFITHLKKSRLPDGDLSDDGRLEIRVEARNQHFSTFSTAGSLELQLSRAFASGIRKAFGEPD